MTRTWMAAAVVMAGAMGAGFAAGAMAASAASSTAQATIPVVPPAAPPQAQAQAKAKAEAPAQARMPVVASFSILGDLVEQVGGDRVAVTTLVGRDSDAHVFQPAPRDVKTVSVARVLVINGRGFDGWMSRLASTGGARAGRVTIDATAALPDDAQASPQAAMGGQTPSASQARKDEHDHGQAKANVRGHDHSHGHDHGTVDPHAWQDSRQVIGYVRAIEAGLTRADPNGAAYFAQRADAYVQQLQALDAWIVKRIADVPAAKRKVITSHDAFGYFAARYGVTMLAVSGVSTNADAGARDMANIIGLMRREKVKALFLENIANPRLIEQIAKETGAEVGGRLYSDALSATNGPAPTYLAMMRHNVDTLVAGMQRN